MSHVEQLIYFQEEKAFGTIIEPKGFSKRSRKFDIAIYQNRQAHSSFFNCLATVFTGKEGQLISRAELPSNPYWHAEVKASLYRDEDGNDTGFFHDAETFGPHHNKGLSTLLRSLLTQAFMQKHARAEKIVGEILAHNIPSLKARFFMMNPQTHEYYYTTVTDCSVNPLGEEEYVVTTFPNKPSHLEVQTALYSQYKKAT